ncbi:DUF423 domain-containing protein [Allohahella sp. A8]|uniref:DUF423 domain-containing protein n=1 Tax=Allohahella sp. A8 TaxID=3141461 RepID=UPI000C0A5E23|nr:DUF423 domain-containing protein [Hahellaceae bacterium]|tara:strand:- start:42354 stop:42749 length:396 start_codon:yes stop_codon:yes gene_type:complete
MLTLVIAALFGCTAIAMGAYAEHGLRVRIDEEAFRSVMTAVRYHQVHAVTLLALALAMLTPLNPTLVFRLGLSAGLFVLGTLMFSGSIYAAFIMDSKPLLKITPAGGMCLMVAWLSLIWAALATGPQTISE